MRQLEVDQMLILDLVLWHHEVEETSSQYQMAFNIKIDEVFHSDGRDQQDRNGCRPLCQKCSASRRKL